MLSHARRAVLTLLAAAVLLAAPAAKAEEHGALAMDVDLAQLLRTAGLASAEPKVLFGASDARVSLRRVAAFPCG